MSNSEMEWRAGLGLELFGIVARKRNRECVRSVDAYMGGCRLVCALAPLLVVSLSGCGKPQHLAASLPLAGAGITAKPNPVPVIHVVVALCDNKYQGIVPVPARIGNGDDLIDNLYWGADLGVKSYFRRLKDWKLVQSVKDPAPKILERVIFRKSKGGAILVADAYRGREIKAATEDFMSFAAGASPLTLSVLGKELSGGGGADMLVYVGHDGLMNFQLSSTAKHQDARTRKVAILCCKSQQFFGPSVQAAGAEPLLWTKSLMAPEAYVLEAAVQSFLKHENGSRAVERASAAYAKYQHCSVRAARTVFASGF